MIYRGLEFIHCFLLEVVHGQQDLTVAAGNNWGEGGGGVTGKRNGQNFFDIKGSKKGVMI